mgnify:FL=1
MHQGTIIKRDDKGAIVSLPYGLEAYGPGKHLRYEDGTSAQLDQTTEFCIIEFDRNDKRIIVSITEAWRRKKAKAERAARAEQNNQEERTRKRMQRMNQAKGDKSSTFGDLDVLSQLKKEMEERENK